MRTVLTILAAATLAAFPAYAQAPSPAQPAPAAQGLPPTQPAPAPQGLPPAQAPSPTQPASAPQGTPAPGPVVVPPPVVPLVPFGGRTFMAPAGLIFSAVRPDRVVDFEMVIGYLQAAFEKSTDAGVRAQAQGWRVFKAVEAGPNGSVLYVFLIDPAVTGADYGLGRILSDAYPDQIQNIWKLYTGAVTGGGSLVNLTPVQPPPLPAPGTPALTTPETTPRPAPPAGP